MPTSSDNQFGKYELLERIAAGGMAEIFRARFSPAPGVVKPVVIKRILPHYAANRAFIAMFTNEARIVMGLSHGNIAQVFDFGEVDGDWYLAMELVDGQPLSKVVKRMRATGITTMPPALAAWICAEMLRGLHYAHTRLDEQGRPLQIVHRDVSPQNVLLSYEGQVKLVDFGIARARNAGREDTSSSAVKGKYAYFAPEQARGKDLDARTDVFAAGIVLFELLTGQLPFQGPMMEVLTRIVRGQFLRPSELNPQVPKALEQLVLKAMALEKGDRYPSAEAFQQDLTRYLAVNHPDFTPSELSNLLQLLFETELVRAGRPVQLPRSFMEKAQRWQQGAPVPEPAVEALPPPGEDSEAEVQTEMVELESSRPELPPVPGRPREDDDVATAALRVPASANDLLAPGTASASFPWSRALALGVAAALLSFAGVMLVVRANRGTLEITSTPAGSAVRLDGRPIAGTTPLQVSALSGGRTYRVEVSAEGYQRWTNDVPLKRGQHLVVEAVLEAQTPAVVPEVAGPAPVEQPFKQAPVARPTPVDEVKWPTAHFELDAARHRVDLSAGGALRVPLDEQRTYRVTLSRGPALGWGYYVINTAGAAPGALPLAPQQIKGAKSLFVFRLATSALTGTTRPEETKARTLLIEQKGKPKIFPVPLTLPVPLTARVTLTGLNPKATYDVTVTQSFQPATLRPAGAAVRRCVVGHPTKGLLLAEVGAALRVTDASRLFFTLLDDADDEQQGRLIIDVAAVKKRAR